MTTIVGIAGRKFAGKDTAANVLVEERGYVNVKFAGGIKKIARAFFAFVGYGEHDLIDLTEGILKEEHLQVLADNPDAFAKFVEAEAEGVLFEIFQVDLRTLELPAFTGTTSREFQQFIGTEIGRNLVSKTVWTDAALRDAQQYEKVVISDVRFPNEVDIVHDNGGTVIRIERDAAEGNAFSDHPSETAIDTLDVDVVIDNNHTLNDLYWSVLIATGEAPEDHEATGFFKEVE